MLRPLFGAPPGLVNLQLTPEQISFLTDPHVWRTMAVHLRPMRVSSAVSSGTRRRISGQWSGSVALGLVRRDRRAFPTWPDSQQVARLRVRAAPVPGSYQTLTSQTGNFPVFEGTSLYSLRLDHNISSNNRLMLRANVSPSTVTGIEVSGQDQPFGQNAYSRTSQQTYRDVAGTVAGHMDDRQQQGE